MASEIATIIPSLGLGGIGVWAAQAAAAYFKSRGDRAAKQVDIDTTLEVHKDKLTFELLKAAREEVAAARIEAAEVRSMQLRLVHFDEALDHIEALMNAADDPIALKDAKRRATQYLTRMRRFSEVNGTLKNEMQVQLVREAQAGLDAISLNGKIAP